MDGNPSTNHSPFENSIAKSQPPSTSDLKYESHLTLDGLVVSETIPTHATSL